VWVVMGYAHERVRLDADAESDEDEAVFAKY
jgi:hypothetical protein